MDFSQSWRPTAEHATLIQRAKLLRDIREFFYERHVLEVDTPLLSAFGVTEPHTLNLSVKDTLGNELGYLQTSPEYAMKRLLCSGVGSIYQIGKAFRDDQESRYHSPEFTLLEWYRVGFNMAELMDEIDELLLMLLDCASAKRFSYQQSFHAYLDIDPWQCELSTLKAVAKHKANYESSEDDERDTLLNLLFSTCIEPHLGFNEPCFVFHYPNSQASLAATHPEDANLALRFELFINGVEIANGFEELTQVKEQRRRFEQDNRERQKMGLPHMAIDERFLSSLEAGLPICSGVALGVERLMMIIKKAQHIEQVIAFPYSRA
ncbi:MAG: elongation factor P--(R)-beta-lysine ligase [Pseudomonadota bacterium]